MNVPTRARRTQVLVLGGLVALAVLASPFVEARAESPEAARRAWSEGRGDDAYRLLRAWLLTEPTDAEGLLAAARLAAEMRDLELVERVQGRAEIASADAPDPRLDLALGLSYLALAEIRLVAGTPSPTLAFLFADAEALAKKLVDEHPDTAYAWEGRMLWARTRQALGDLDGALEALDVATTWDGKARLVALLRYERAVTQGLDAEARPTEAGAADLRAALDVLAGATDFEARIRAAWAAHRLGLLDDARAHYVAAWSLAASSEYPLRGLQSLAAGRPELLIGALEEVLAAVPRDTRALDALAEAQLPIDATAAIVTLERRLALDERDPSGWMLGARLFLEMRQWREARKHARRALEIDPAFDPAAGLLQRIAHTLASEDLERSVSIYEELVDLRPEDPLVWNNFGFLLREAVSPYTDLDEETGLQTLRDDAPPRARALLDRCVAAYRRAAALVPTALEGRPENEVWVLAGVLNDCGLMLHYFTDVQAPHEAERLYLRALAVTGYGYMDAYVPNLRRLYAHVLTDRDWAWYRAACEARWSQLTERRRADGTLELVPDETRRDIAAADARALRARLLAGLEADAEEAGDPWPPEAGEEDEGR